MIIFIKKWHDREQKGYGMFGRLYREMETARFNAIKENRLIKMGVAKKFKTGKQNREVKDDHPDKREKK